MAAKKKAAKKKKSGVPGFIKSPKLNMETLFWFFWGPLLVATLVLIALRFLFY